MVDFKQARVARTRERKASRKNIALRGRVQTKRTKEQQKEHNGKRAWRIEERRSTSAASVARSRIAAAGESDESGEERDDMED